MTRISRLSTLFLLLAMTAVGIAVSISEGTDEPEDSEVISLGKLVFEETAGGVGCAYCHGLTAQGNGTAGVNAPSIVGVQEAALRASLSGAVPMMSFIELTEEEFQAVLAYLKYLAENPQPPAGTPADEDK